MIKSNSTVEFSRIWNMGTDGIVWCFSKRNEVKTHAIVDVEIDALWKVRVSAVWFERFFSKNSN